MDAWKHSMSFSTYFNTPFLEDIICSGDDEQQGLLDQTKPSSIYYLHVLVPSPLPPPPSPSTLPITSPPSPSVIPAD